MTHVPAILIVDDDPTTVLLLDKLLRREGYRTFTAVDGAGGRRAVLRDRPDLILLDVQMPDENGLDVCRALKANPDSADIPILFVSGEDDVESKVAGLDAGAVDYVTKPFQQAEVLARVRTHLRLSRASRAIVELQSVRLSQLASAQQAILPQPERMPDAKFAVAYRPLDAAGGDFVEVIQAGESVTDYIVADLSGHNVGTALSTAALEALFQQNCNLTDPPAMVLTTVNRVLRRVLPDGCSATLAYARVNRLTRRIALASAGHPAPILAPRRGGARALPHEGDVLGAFDAAIFGQHEVSVQVGDRLYLYSDGLVELSGPGDGPSATGRLAGVCAACTDRPLAEAVETVVARVLSEAAPRDDVVLLGIEI